jgi:hypothetical protein
MQRFKFWLLFYILSIAPGLAVGQIAIPRQFNGTIATDLSYQGRTLTQNEAYQLLQNSLEKFDLSLLDPENNSDVWGRQSDLSVITEQSIPIDYMDELDFQEEFISTNEFHRFNVTTKRSSDFYTLYIGKNIHSVLMRRELLKKLGYHTPPIKYLKQVRINFADVLEKNLFVRSLSENTMTDPNERWIVSNPKNEAFIIVQDLVATLSVEPIYNFAFAVMDKSIAQDLRSINALIVPFNLVYFEESVNMMPWSAGRIVSNRVYLPGPSTDEFNTKWEDARWITRKILELTRQDFQEIVAASNAPKSVQALLIEKILARRNSLSQLFDIDTIEFKIQSNLTNGEHLVDGKLSNIKWEGYGTRFAQGDPDSPLSGSEVFSMIKSKALSTAIDAVVTSINSIPFLSTDIEAKNQSEIDKILAEALAQSIQSGLAQEIPVKSWTYPVASGRLLLSRNIIAGSYLGTDNIIQLADTIGVSISAGLFTGVAGLDQPLGGFGVSTAANFTRSYTHLKPVSSIQKSLKYPFKNMAVPMLKHRYGKFFSEIGSAKFLDKPETEQQEIITRAMDLFTKEMEVGESILVTDTLGVGANLQAAATITPWLTIPAGVSPNQTVIARLHIHRKDEKTIQVYKDYGDMTSFEISLGLNVAIPVVRSSAKFARGSAKTNFFAVTLDKNSPKIIDELRALKNVLYTGVLASLKRVQKPWVLKHKFKENEQKVGIFTLRFNRIKSHTYMSLTPPDQSQEKNFFRRYKGHSIGNDYLSYANDLLGFLSGKLLSTNFNMSGLGGGNPGNSINGKAKNKISTFEAEINSNGKLERPMIKITRLWNGWRIKQAKAIKILEKMRRDYQFRFFSKDVLNDTKKIFLYNITLNFHFFPEGIAHLRTLSEEQIKFIFKTYYKKSQGREEENQSKLFGNGALAFMKQIEKSQKYDHKDKHHEYSNAMIEALEIAETKLSLAGIKALLGGEENFFIVAKIDGFRHGAEDANNKFDYTTDPYMSHSLGEVGVFGPAVTRGPLAEFMDLTGMIQGEFYINWLMGRIY